MKHERKGKENSHWATNNCYNVALFLSVLCIPYPAGHMLLPSLTVSNTLLDTLQALSICRK